MINDLDAQGGVPVGAVLETKAPPVAPERIAALNGMLWQIANEMIAKGHPVEHVAQAYFGFATMTAERVSDGTPWLVKFMLAETSRDLKSDSYDLSVNQKLVDR
jgi:hypothetical protein